MWQDLTLAESVRLCEPQPFAFTTNAQIYNFKDGQKVVKLHGSQHEFEMLVVAGDCSVRPCGRLLELRGDGSTYVKGFIMKRERPLDTKGIDHAQREIIADQMIAVVLALHCKGIVHGDIKPANMLICSDGKVRLCDFAEARRVDEALNEWEGATTANYVAPSRNQDWRHTEDPPPTINDDLYALGLSIWELYTEKMPFDGEYEDDIRDALERSETVDVDEVQDESVKSVIRKYLRYGGAKI